MSGSNSSSTGSGISMGTILWFFIIPALLVWFNESKVDPIGEFLVLLIWLVFISFMCVFTIIGWWLFAEFVGPFFTGYITTEGLMGVFGTYAAFYLWISVAITLILLGIIGFIIYVIYTNR